MTDTLADEETKTEPDAEEEPGEEFVLDTNASLAFGTKKFVLQALLDKAAAVLPTRDTMPVLKNFQIEVGDGKISVIATDLELSVVAATNMVTVERPGMAVFPGKRLLDLAKEAEDGDLILDVVEGKAHIAVGRTTWDLMLMDGSEYPPLPDIDEVDFITVDRGKFMGAMQGVKYAAATDTVRPSLMMIDISEGKMRASDGVRFQQVTLENFPLDLHIPIAAVDDLARLLRSTDQPTMEIGETDEHLVFQIAGDVFIANKLTAVFPDVEEMLLKPALANSDLMSVDRQDLMAAIKRVRVTADPETNAIMLQMADGRITVHSRDKFGNQASEGLDAFWESGDITVAVNHQYLLEMLTGTDVSSCRFFLGKGPKTRPAPVLLRDDEAGAIGVLNQMRVDWLD